jgi:2-polyprenyl-3-methyl-5-hydroxy-6-metoxy-1,4-benzoquinol methylase
MPTVTKSNENLYRKAIERECGSLTATTLVDIGSADGSHTAKLAKLSKAKKVVCIDHDLNDLQKAKKYGFHTIQADLNEKFQMSVNSADIVVIDQVIEHISKTDVLAAEVYRILKPGGKAIWSTPNLASWHNIFSLIFGYQPFSSQISDRAFIGNPWHPMNNKKINEAQAHLRLFTPYSLASLLKFHHFNIETNYTVGYYPFKNHANILAKIDPTHGAYIVIVSTKQAK